MDPTRALLSHLPPREGMTLIPRGKIKACSVFPNSKRIKHVTNTNLAGWSVGESEEEGEGNVGNENHQEADPSPRPHS